jgi:23S rRNA pseudouridine955/2504/2580 synthase
MSCQLKSESIKKNEAKRVKVSPERDGQRIDNFLSARLKGVPKSAIYRLIRTGQVRINGKRCKPERKLTAGDEVRIPPVRVLESGPVGVSDAVVRQVREAILYRDENYLVIDKPSGMAVHSGSGLRWGLIDALRQAMPGEYLELAHRIDRATSGCVVLARSGQALSHLAAQFRNGSVAKRYLCLLDGCMQQARLTVDVPLLKVRQGGEHVTEADEDGKQAVTRFRLLQAFPDCSYAEAELFTGRTHQIRAHAAHLGLPLAGDERYGSAEALKKWQARGLKRLFLHAHQLGFESLSGAGISCNAPLPEDLRQVLEHLGA